MLFLSSSKPSSKASSGLKSANYAGLLRGGRNEGSFIQAIIQRMTLAAAAAGLDGRTDVGRGTDDRRREADSPLWSS